MFRWHRTQGLHFIGENRYQNTGGETGWDGASPKRHNLLLYSSDPDAESSELGGVLASSSSSESSLRLLFFLPLFSPEELSSLDTNSLLLKLSLSCLDEDFDDEPREGVDFFSIFTLTFFFFLDLSLGEQEGRGCWALGFPASSGPNLSWLSQGLSQSQPHCPAHAKRTQPGVSALSAPGELIITESQEGSGATA